MVQAKTDDFLLDNINHILYIEPNLADEYQSLVCAVNRMHEFFNPEGKPYPRYILDKIEELGVESEDAIDTYVFDFLRQQADKCIFWQAKRKLVQFAGLRGVAEGILRIQTRKFEELYNEFIDKNHQETVEQDDDEMIESSLSPSSIEEDEGECYLNYVAAAAVEFEVEEKILIEKVISGDAELRVISITGMNYSARSTLAAKVFCDPIVVGHFDLVARIWVSRLRTWRECLEVMMESIVELTDDVKEAMSEKELRSDLERYLTSTRYLIVLDGVCSSSRILDYLVDLIPKNNLGSRIILTDDGLAEAISTMRSVTFSCCDLQLLSAVDSRNLLYSKVFRGGGCPSELTRIGNRIAKRCAGLPLAIVLVAGVLQWKKTPSWWRRVDRSLGKINNVDDESEILELIYSYLPHHLKLCFLYFGHFPEECEIRARQLINLWIAEGFVVVPKSGQKLMEEAAVEYLEDLISWNLIQTAQNKSGGGGVKSLRIHHFLHVFCMSKAHKIKDLEVRVYDKSSPQCKSRRILIHSGTLHFIKSNPYAPKLRSLICFGGGGERISSRQWKPVYSGYILLRVLELWGVVVDNIPSEIGNLIGLRYLRLKSDSAKVLPFSINNLCNLKTLEVVAPLIERPQVNIWKMMQLRHFFFNGEADILDPPTKMDDAEYDCLSNLQTLSTISPKSCTESVVSKVPNIVKLGINGDLETQMKSAFNNLPKLKLVRKLKVMRDLRYGRLGWFPNGDKFPPMLVKLTLMQTELSVDPMKQLAQLPNLQVLKLIDSAYGGAVLDCSNCEFHKLKVLKLVKMGITRWSVSTKSMPSLQNLVIDRCGSLVDLPSDDLKNMSTLRELQLRWPNLSMVKCAREIATYKEKKQEQLKLMIYHAEADRGTMN